MNLGSRGPNIKLDKIVFIFESQVINNWGSRGPILSQTKK